MDQAFQDVVDRTAEDVEDVEDVQTAAPISPALAMARASAARRAAQVEAAPEPKARAWGRDLTMLIRRSHLYAGLLLYPWVLLYGITAFLFNHPSAFSDQTFTQFGPEQMKGTALESLPTPADLAAKVVAAINARSEGGAAYTLVKPESARFDRGGLGATVQAGDGKSYTVSLDREGGMIRLAPATTPGAPTAGGRGGNGGPAEKGGVARKGRGEGGPGGREGRSGGREGEGEGGPETKGARRGRGGPGGAGEGGTADGGRGGEGPAAPFATSDLTVDGLPLDAIRESLPTVLARAGLVEPRVSEVRVAPLSFQIEGEGRTWLASYNAQTGFLSGRAVDDPASQAELTTRRFLLRLHLIHGYPSEFGQRWIWAFIVDAMAFLMVFWGVSGLIMWWQIKRTRKIGAVALTFSTAAAVWIGVGMHYHFVNGGR